MKNKIGKLWGRVEEMDTFNFCVCLQLGKS